MPSYTISKELQAILDAISTNSYGSGLFADNFALRFNQQLRNAVQTPNDFIALNKIPWGMQVALSFLNNNKTDTALVQRVAPNGQALATIIDAIDERRNLALLRLIDLVDSAVIKDAMRLCTDNDYAITCLQAFLDRKNQDHLSSLVCQR